MFSLGVVFFILAFGDPPFKTTDLSDGYLQILHKRPHDYKYFFRYHPNTRRLFSQNKIPDSLMKMLAAMFCSEASQRIQKVEQLLEF